MSWGLKVYVIFMNAGRHITAYIACTYVMIEAALKVVANTRGEDIGAIS